MSVHCFFLSFYFCNYLPVLILTCILWTDGCLAVISTIERQGCGNLSGILYMGPSFLRKKKCAVKIQLVFLLHVTCACICMQMFGHPSTNYMFWWCFVIERYRRFSCRILKRLCEKKILLDSSRMSRKRCEEVPKVIDVLVAAHLLWKIHNTYILPAPFCHLFWCGIVCQCLCSVIFHVYTVFYGQCISSTLTQTKTIYCLNFTKKMTHYMWGKYTRNI